MWFQVNYWYIHEIVLELQVHPLDTHEILVGLRYMSMESSYNVYCLIATWELHGYNL
jgi:hypothetical protein